MKKISLTKEQVALVDDEDFERVNQFKWYAYWNSHTESFYAERADYSSGSHIHIPMARFIMNCPDDMLTDHKNHDTLDNQKHNLRICTYSENGQNSRPSRSGTSQYKGVSWYTQTKKWVAHIRLRDIFGQLYTQHLGYFEDEEEAAKAFDRAATKYHGEFAYLNFPLVKDS